MQLYESISLKDAWWNICCPDCGSPMADNPYRRVNITWSEILNMAIDLWGKPDGFFVRDFLISLEFRKGQVILIFCSQGSRRGEVQISTPAGDEEARDLLKPFLNKIREQIEAQPTESQDYYEREEYYEEEFQF